MKTVHGFVVSENQFAGYVPPVYHVQHNERVLDAQVKRESGNYLTLYITVERDDGRS